MNALVPPPPPAPEPKEPSILHTRLVPMLACGAVALVGFISRRPDQWFAPQFWGEDGKIFFFEAATEGWSSWLKPAVGCLYLAPRTIACLAAPLPWEYLPIVYGMAAALLAAAVVTRIAFADLPRLPRLLGALTLLVIPHSGEVFLNITNVHWILGALAGVNLLEAEPRTRGAAWRRTAEVTFAGLSGPLSLIFSPFALAWIWRQRRERLCRPVAVAWIFVIVVQAALWLTSSRNSTADPTIFANAAMWLVPGYAATLFVGQWVDYTPVLGWAVTAIMLGIFGGLFLDSSNPQRGRAVMLLVLAMAVLAAGRVTSGVWANPFGYGGRYAYLPFVFTLWALLFLADGSRRTVFRLAALALVTCAAVSAFSAWQARPLPQYEWTQQVRQARAGQRIVFIVPPNWTFPVPGAPENVGPRDNGEPR
jgi:hypothetical protein